MLTRITSLTNFTVWQSGWWFEPLWKIWKSVGMIIPNTVYGKIKTMFQTTNQPFDGIWLLVCRKNRAPQEFHAFSFFLSSKLATRWPIGIKHDFTIWHSDMAKQETHILNWKSIYRRGGVAMFDCQRAQTSKLNLQLSPTVWNMKLTTTSYSESFGELMNHWNFHDLVWFWARCWNLEPTWCWNREMKSIMDHRIPWNWRSTVTQNSPFVQETNSMDNKSNPHILA